MNEVTTGEPACVSETAAQEEEDGGVVSSWFVVDDETTSELSNLLDLFEAPPPPFRVRFIDDPYSSPVIFQSSSAYVTINGNEESCGSSFSDSESSVMASIDVGAARTTRGACFFEDVDVELGGFWMGALIVAMNMMPNMQRASSFSEKFLSKIVEKGS